jgi:catechol 2,3-dioxygenase-like lactoylglutathione lyase family enzyme
MGKVNDAMVNLLVNIDVDDLEKAVSFYVRGLGLKPGRRLGAQAREMLGASCAIYLLENADSTRPFAAAASLRDYRRHWTPVHLDFEVEDIDAAVARAVSAGARLEGEVEDRAWGRLARMADPFGHGFCLLQFQGRGYDEMAEASPE